MGEYEKAVERLKEEGLDDLAEFFEGFSGSTLRKKAERLETLEREKSDLEAKVKRLEQGPVVQEAFRKAGVDFDALRPAERKLLAELEVDGEIDDEFVSRVISENELPIAEGTVAQGTQTGAEQVVRAAEGAPKGLGPKRATITVAEVSEWPADKYMRFKAEHPEAAEAVKRGEDVEGLTFE